MVRYKTRLNVLLLHVCIVTAVSWAALGFPLQPFLLLLIAASHFAIDWLKLRHGSGSFGPFVVDQAAHLFDDRARRHALPRRLAAGLWATAARAFALLPQAMALGAGFVSPSGAATTPSGR